MQRPDSIQLGLPGLGADIPAPVPVPCANPACRSMVAPDPLQPGKRYCSVRCRTIRNNALIMARSGRKPADRWPDMEPESMDRDHWDEYSAFAGGTEAGASAFLKRLAEHRPEPEEGGD